MTKIPCPNSDELEFCVYDDEEESVNCNRCRHNTKMFDSVSMDKAKLGGEDGMEN